MNISVSQKRLQLAGYLLLAIPTIAFLLLTLKFWIGAVCSIGLLTALYFAFRGYNNDAVFSIPLKNLALVAVIVMTWCLLCGQGGYFAQKTDHHWRNAIMRDMVNYDWPVTYEDGSGLVYYIGYWTVPAIIGKCGLYFGADAAWSIANAALLLWSTLNISVVTLLILAAFNRSDIISCLFVCGILVFFSGMDVVGYALYGLATGRLCFPWNIEWWLNWSDSITLAFTSNTHQLGWVFNQAIPAWVGAILYYRERRVETAAYIGMLLLPYSPFPLLGLFFIAVIDGVCNIFIRCKKGEVLSGLLSPFSIPNLVSIIVILPVFYLYYSSNLTVVNTIGSCEELARQTSSSIFTFVNIHNWTQFFHYIVFCLLEFGILGMLIFKENRSERLFIISILALLFVGATKIISMDYILRSSIIPLFFLMLYTIKYFLEDNKTTWQNFFNKFTTKNFRFILVSLCLLLGSATAVCEFMDSAYITQDCVRHGYKLPADRLGTLANSPQNSNQNFLIMDTSTSPFYNYIARKPHNNIERIHEVNNKFDHSKPLDVYDYKHK